MEFLDFKGGRLLHVNGHLYKKNRTNKNGSVIYKCREDTCWSRGTLTGEEFEQRGEHNHPDQTTAIEMLRRRTEAIDRAKAEPSTSMKRIYTEAFNDIEDHDDCGAVPSYKKLRSCMYRSRAGRLPKLPTSGAEYIQGERRETKSGPEIRTKKSSPRKMEDSVSVGSRDPTPEVTSPSGIGESASPPTMVKLAGSRGWLESERRYMQRRLDQLEERERRMERFEEEREMRNYLCTICSSLCETSSDLQTHLSKHVSDLKDQTDSRICTICSLEFISKMALTVHRNSPRHKEREMRIRSLFHCDHCGNYFANRDAYAMHMLDVTREASSGVPNGSEKKPYGLGLVVSEVDTLSFLQSLAGKSVTNSSASSPVEVVKVKEEPRDDSYGDIGKNGVSSSTNDSSPKEPAEKMKPLDLSHMKNETRMSPLHGHVCRVCAQVFDSRDALAMHAMEHCKDDSAENSGVPITITSCYICGYRAPSLGALSVHMLIHARPMDLTNDPSKLLTQLGYGDLVSEIILQNDNSFTCKLCDLEFSNFPAVIKHCSRVMHIVKVEQLLRRNFISDSTLKCSDCNKTFERDCDYKIHKTLLCQAVERSSLQSPEQSVCSEPSVKRKRPNEDVTRRASSETGLWSAASTSRKCATPVERPSSSRPLSVDSGRSASPDHEAAANRAQILSYLETQDFQMCTYCKIVYTDRTMYYLHMGLHNHNNPWQCNLCGKVCANVHEFSSHVIHYSG